MKTKEARELDAKLKALGIHTPSRELLKRLSMEDLRYLIEPPSRLKTTYVYDRNISVEGEELRKWIDMGLISIDATKAKAAGYTPEALEELIHVYGQIDPQRKRESVIWALIQKPVSADFLRACQARRYDVDWVREAIDDGASIEAMDGLKQSGIPLHFMPVAGALDRGESRCDAAALKLWYDTAIEPSVAARLIDAEVGPEEAQLWYKHGFLSKEIIESKRRGLRLEDQLADRPDVSFSQAFRHRGEGAYAPRGDFGWRLRRAMNEIDVPAFGSSMMFATSRAAYPFLDGGYTRVDGYGFGSPSYSYVRGPLAVRFACARIGVKFPRRIKDSAEDVPYEHMIGLLNVQRQNDVIDLFMDDFVLKPGR
ncbi:hypothetical protein [Zhengella sedimenti]|uniref:hypothetical protein n=1 Tax=Zhengella sedimenti TaxID=3390035 RepID=UPI003975883F